MFIKTCKVNGKYFSGDIKDNQFVMDKFMDLLTIKERKMDIDTIDNVIRELQLIKGELSVKRGTNRRIRIEGLNPR